MKKLEAVVSANVSSVSQFAGFAHCGGNQCVTVYIPRYLGLHLYR